MEVLDEVATFCAVRTFTQPITTISAVCCSPAHCTRSLNYHLTPVPLPLQAVHVLHNGCYRTHTSRAQNTVRNSQARSSSVSDLVSSQQCRQQHDLANFFSYTRRKGVHTAFSPLHVHKCAICPGFGKDRVNFIPRSSCSLYFGFSVRIMLITQGCFSHCSAVLNLSSGFFSPVVPASSRTRSWEGAQPGHPNLSPNRDISHHRMSCPV